jgi:hypothetical protein
LTYAQHKKGSFITYFKQILHWNEVFSILTTWDNEVFLKVPLGTQYEV